MLAVDHAICAWVIAHRVDALNGLMLALSAIGRGGLIWVLVALALTVLRRFRLLDWVTLAVSLAAASAVTDQVVKPAVNRERPFQAMAVDPLGHNPSDSSFPSGHSANAAAGALVLSRTAPGGLIYWLVAAAVGYSRIYLGMHYPLDVIGGGLIGWACAELVLYVRRRAQSALVSPNVGR